MIAIRGLKMPVDCSVCFGRGAIWCRFDESDRIVVPALPDDSFEGRPEWCPLVDVPDEAGNCSEFPNNSDCISRQMTVDEIGKRAERCAERFGTDDPFWEGLIIAKTIVECVPFVRPERKKGVWKTVAFLTSECSECHEQIHELEYGNFCPCCGADMRGEQE